MDWIVDGRSLSSDFNGGGQVAERACHQCGSHLRESFELRGWAVQRFMCVQIILALLVTVTYQY
jgi:hypothetical protein